MGTESVSAAAAPPRRRFSGLRRLASGFLWCCLGLATAWAVAALYFDVRIPVLRVPLAAVYALAITAVWVRVRRPWKAPATAAGFALVLAWWLSLQPSNSRDWQPDVAVLPFADIAGTQIIIHNIRNCDYRSETDYDVRYYNKTFNLDDLRAVDLYLVTWGSPHIAHTMASFGFANAAPRRIRPFNF